MRRLCSCDSMCDQQRSAGSFDIVEAEDLCDSGIHLDQHCLPGHNGHLGQGGYLEHSEQVTHFAGCGRILVQKLRPVSREDSAEDYYDILLVKNHSGGDQPKLHEYAPTASLPRIPHTVLISEETHQLAMQSSLMSPSTNPLAVQPVTSSAVPLSSHSTSSAYPASSPLAVTASSPTSLSRPTAIVPCITSTALPTSSGIDTIAEGLVQDRISQICLLESAELHCGSDSIGSHVEDTNASPLRLMGTLDLGAPDDVDKDGTVSGNTCPMATGSEVGKTFNILGGGGLSNTSGEKDLRIASDLGMVSRTSQATNGGELGVAFNAGHLGMGRSGQATGQATNGGELRMASSARQIGVKSSSTGGVQAQHPSSNGSCVSYPGTSCNYGNRKNQTLIPRHGSDPGTVPVFLKKRNLCDVTRAFSEPTASDLVTADLLTEITMFPPSEPSSQSLTESTHYVSSSPSEEDISMCIKTRCNDFLNYTNWKLLLPHLMANELLDRDITEVLMNNYMTNLDKGLKFYLSVLPSKGNTAYSRFYQCVSEEEEHSGHRTLLELMDNFIKT